MSKAAICILLGCLMLFTAFRKNETNTFQVPEGWPAPVYDFKKNPLHPAQVEIGRELFYDPVLSLDSTISCASCHLQYTAFAHTDHDLSHGINGKIGTRNAPSLINLAWSKTFRWDGAVNHIEMQALAPITNPLEMGETIDHVLQKMRASSYYAARFYNAFGDSAITTQRVLRSLAQFMLTLVSANARYDQVKKGATSFSPQEAQGYKLFQQHCNACHTEPLFTNGQFENNGLPVDETLQDKGRIIISGVPADSLKFKVPSLRNVALSYPYMHDGRFKTLNQVLNHYIMNIAQSNTLNPVLRKGIYLTATDKADLIAFLLTLTDETFLHNPAFSFRKTQ